MATLGHLQKKAELAASRGKRSQGMAKPPQTQQKCEVHVVKCMAIGLYTFLRASKAC